MFKKVLSSGVNFGVLLISLGVFAAALLILLFAGNSSKPKTIDILVLTRDVNIGDVLSSSTLTRRTVHQDDAGFYILADEIDTVVGGVMALPAFAGQPLLKTSVISEAGEGYRLSAVLAEFPGHSLFPLPLDANNVIAPDAASFLPGDLINLTVVIGRRPQAPNTPTAVAFSSVILPTPVGTPAATEPVIPDDLAYPPLSKDLFPAGVRVIAVQGLPTKTTASTQTSGGSLSSSASSSSSSSSTNLNKPKLLILLVPNEAREILALALQQGDMLVVSLLARSEDQATAGFTYWDFETMFEQDREAALLNSMPTATPTSRLTGTQSPATPILSTPTIIFTPIITDTLTMTPTVTATP